MSPVDVRDRLDDRFRLLAGSGRGLERHQTLRHAVQWSYDLLGDEERILLCACSVFAGGFDLASAVQVFKDGADEYEVLDLLDSLVRKSLIIAERSAGHARYGLLETIRQYAEEQLAASGATDRIRDRHARYFAADADANFEKWWTPRQSDVAAWLDRELANLRGGFRWATGRADLQEAAAIIAGNTAAMGARLGFFEPVAWAEELLDAARAHRLRRLRWLYVGAANCMFLGRAEAAVGYGEAGLALLGDPRYDPVPADFDYFQLALAHYHAGRPGKFLEVAEAGLARSSDPAVLLRSGVVMVLTSMRRFDEAMERAVDAVAAAEASALPWSLAWALYTFGQAFGGSDPARALVAMRRALSLARESNNRLLEAISARGLASLEARHGEPRAALDSFDQAIDSPSGSSGMVTATLGELAVFFDRIGWLRAAATVYGASTRDVYAANVVAGLARVAEHLRAELGADVFDDLESAGAGLDRGQAVRYAHTEIQNARAELAAKE